MFKKFLPLFLLLVLISTIVGCEDKGSGQSATQTGSKTDKASEKVDDEVAVLETDMGNIVIEFFIEDAPKHVANFKKLTKEGFYDGVAFHRIIPGMIIQGGDPNSKNGPKESWGMGQPSQQTVPSEFNGHKHTRGIVSAARKGNDVNSATSQFFVCISAKPDWDGQYSIFGRVVEGMEVVDIIASSPKEEGSERPAEKIVIKKASLAKRADFRQTPQYK
jgi:cyclophilin family peptidyl-prolyl cis-trans isomerase